MLMLVDGLTLQTTTLPRLRSNTPRFLACAHARSLARGASNPHFLERLRPRTSLALAFLPAQRGWLQQPRPSALPGTPLGRDKLCLLPHFLERRGWQVFRTSWNATSPGCHRKHGKLGAQTI